MISRHFDEGPFDMTEIDFYGRTNRLPEPFTTSEWKRAEMGREWVVAVDDAEEFRVADAVMPRFASKADREKAKQWLLDMLAVFKKGGG